MSVDSKFSAGLPPGVGLTVGPVPSLGVASTRGVVFKAIVSSAHQAHHAVQPATATVLSSLLTQNQNNHYQPITSAPAVPPPLPQLQFASTNNSQSHFNSNSHQAQPLQFATVSNSTSTTTNATAPVPMVPNTQQISQLHFTSTPAAQPPAPPQPPKPVVLVGTKLPVKVKLPGSEEEDWRTQ